MKFTKLLQNSFFFFNYKNTAFYTERIKIFLNKVLKSFAIEFYRIDTNFLLFHNFKKYLLHGVVKPF